jgi:glycosyltransferase involved in cell wall biosynthesis
MRVSVIIPAYNAEATLPLTLASLTPVDGHELEVIVVDDASPDRTSEIARDHADQVLVMEVNRGPSIARNEGAKVASGDVLLFIDADVELLPDALDRVVTTLEEHPDCAGVAGNLSTDSVSETFIGTYKNLYMHFAFRDNARSTGAPYTSIVAVRREVFEDIGGFVDVLPNEDRVFGIELARRGHRVLFDTDIQVRHYRSYRWREFPEVEARRAKNIVQLHLETKLLGRGNMTEHIPYTFILALALVVACPIVALVGVTMWPSLLWAVPACAVSFLATLLPFIAFLGRHQGPIFALASLGFVFVDLFICCVGAAWGICAFVLGQRLIPT